GIEHVRFLTADLERTEGLEALAAGSRSNGVDVALLDPPRAGAAALVRALAVRRPETILYVSCAPAALARDAAVLAAAGYALERVALVDMFPQTTHIEAMALFSLRPPRRRSAEQGRSRRRARATG